jgi:peptide deformylase
MAIRKILTLGRHEKLLRTKSEPIPKINREIKALMKDMVDTMDDSGNAIGLAAIQIGVPKRIFAVRLGYVPRHDDDDDQDHAAAEATQSDQIEKGKAAHAPIDPESLVPVFMINAEIVEHAEDQIKGFEGCLSVPGMLGEAPRYTRIHLKYLDEKGDPQDRWFEQWDARMIQHEMDHLDGVMFMDRLLTLDDLYVMVRQEDDTYKQVPYKNVVARAEKAANKRTISPR